MLSRAAFLCGCLALATAASPARAVNIVVDYTYDTNNFFGSGNPQGSLAGFEARSALNAAAGFLSDILNDTLSPIVTPDPFTSTVSNGIVTWEWQAVFDHPTTGASITLVDETIAADEYRVYAGARVLAGSTIGLGGPGSWGFSPQSSGGFSQSEIDQVNAINDAFLSEVRDRDEASGFASWGGVITFDPTASWHFDHTDDVPANRSDFYTTALHELVHALGFGTSTEWSDLAVGGVFTGAASSEANGGTAPPVTGGHWVQDFSSTVYGSFARQAVLMDPSSITGQRFELTTLDAASLTDIGWQVADPGLLAGDYNFDGQVNAADFTVWRDSLGTGQTIGSHAGWKANYGATAGAGSAGAPEPASVLLLVAAAVSSAARRRR
ncbi:MAG: PEP-CTERM sorting domain-containing protein [Planctomycetota bacterium]